MVFFDHTKKILVSSLDRELMALKKNSSRRSSSQSARVEPYEHSTPKAPLRPDVGTQAQFKKNLPPKMYRYDSSLSPALEWDSNSSREIGEVLLKKIGQAKSLEEAKAAAEELRRLSSVFLNWTGKAERLSFNVPTLPLFVHERLSTEAILATLKGHRKDKQVSFMDDLFKDPRHSVAEQVLKAYEFQDDWVNRMVLGDSLIVMNSLLHYENMAGKVQMVYMDPPYGVNYGSNFQPFVRNRNVGHGDDENMTREPEMVQAYRDTWELGLHSYLTYLRDRILVARDLLSPSGSMFIQISDENLHHVREVLDEVFGAENFVAVINFKTMMPLESGNIESVVDYVCWYAKDKSQLKYRNLYALKNVGQGSEFVFADTKDGGYRRLTQEELQDFETTASKYRIFKRSDLTSSGYTPSCTFPIDFEGQVFQTKRGKSWRTTSDGVEVLKKKNRLFVLGSKLYYKMYLRDFGFTSLINQWTDTIESSGRSYVVQTTSAVIQRCMLMVTDPGDLVVDPTCGSGTTAYVAEQWGRRWITADTSRVPLALARQRLLTATFPYFELKNPGNGPAGGFVYKRKQNRAGEEVGGIVPHITLRSIANDEPADEEILVNRPEQVGGLVRVSGAFTVEATIPTALDGSESDSGSKAVVQAEENISFVERMLEVLRLSPKLQLPGKKAVEFKNVRHPAKTLSLSAEAVVVDGKERPCALVFGPENGAVSERLVHEAARESVAKKYEHLYVFGFAIQTNARELIEHCEEIMGVAATYVQATPDLLMGDLLKNMRSSQIFSVCGLPEISIKKVKGSEYEVKLLGLDVFDPVSMETLHRAGDDVPAWFLDTDYNGLSFHVTQAFFPRTQAWDNLKKALKTDFEESAWSHLAGSESAPFEPGEYKRIAVKVIDDRGNELMVVRDLK